MVWLGEELTEWRAGDPQLPLVAGMWEVGDRPHEEGPGWDSIDAAIAWGRERADEVYIRIGRGADQVYFSAGTINGSPDGGRLPDWPPSFDDVMSIEGQPDEPLSPEASAAIARVKARIAALDES